MSLPLTFMQSYATAQSKLAMFYSVTLIIYVWHILYRTPFLNHFRISRNKHMHRHQHHQKKKKLRIKLQHTT
jgi:hypothetical protein